MTQSASRTDRPAAPPAGGVAERVRAALPGLPPAESRVVQAMLAQGAAVIHMTVNEAAATADAGVGTVLRACQGLGFKGFQDLKISLAQDLLPLAERPYQGVAADDSPAEVLAKLAASSDAAVVRAPASVDPDALRHAVTLLRDARRVLFIGVGTSAPLAQDAAYRLSTIGIPAQAPADVHVQHVQARLLSRGDVAVAVSHTGATRETVAAASGARASGAAVVAVTSFANTPLAEVTDALLVAGSRETAYRVEAMTSRLAHLLVLDTLFVSLVLADPGRSQQAQELAADVLAEHRY